MNLLIYFESLVRLNCLSSVSFGRFCTFLFALILTGNSLCNTFLLSCLSRKSHSLKLIIENCVYRLDECFLGNNRFDALFQCPDKFFQLKNLVPQFLGFLRHYSVMKRDVQNDLKSIIIFEHHPLLKVSLQSFKVFY